MIVDWSCLRRLGVVLGLSSGIAAFPVSAIAQDDDEEEADEGDDEDEEEEDEEEEEDQPPVTAGGLFTKETYPQAEIERPLTITKGMTELRAGIDVDVSAKTAFENWGVGVDARYGFEDNVEGQLHFRSDVNNFDSLDFSAAVEASIVYDLVDFRLGVAVPVTKTTDMATGESTTDTNFDFEVGFPFRYAPKPQVAIIALDTFMTINTDSKPDLTPSVGIIVQPVPMLAIKLHGKIVIVDFDTEAENFRIPVSANIQFSPKNLIDIGGEFTFPNLKPAEDPVTMETPNFYDQRMLLLYGQLRF